MENTDKAIITCALTGVLTDPAKHPVPVTVDELQAARAPGQDPGAALGPRRDGARRVEGRPGRHPQVGVQPQHALARAVREPQAAARLADLLAPRTRRNPA